MKNDVTATPATTRVTVDRPANAAAQGVGGAHRQHRSDEGGHREERTAADRSAKTRWWHRDRPRPPPRGGRDRPGHSERRPDRRPQPAPGWRRPSLPDTTRGNRICHRMSVSRSVNPESRSMTGKPTDQLDDGPARRDRQPARPESRAAPPPASSHDRQDQDQWAKPGGLDTSTVRLSRSPSRTEAELGAARLWPGCRSPHRHPGYRPGDDFQQVDHPRAPARCDGVIQFDDTTVRPRPEGSPIRVWPPRSPGSDRSKPCRPEI